MLRNRFIQRLRVIHFSKQPTSMANGPNREELARLLMAASTIITLKSRYLERTKELVTIFIAVRRPINKR